MTRRRQFWWTCNVCWAQNHVLDSECQFCDCGGPDCARDNCSDPWHFHGLPDFQHTAEEPVDGCRGCDAFRLLPVVIGGAR